MDVSKHILDHVNPHATCTQLNKLDFFEVIRHTNTRQKLSVAALSGKGNQYCISKAWLTTWQLMLGKAALSSFGLLLMHTDSTLISSSITRNPLSQNTKTSVLYGKCARQLFLASRVATKEPRTAQQART